MDPHQPQKCKWEGCRSYDVVSGGIYCQNHKRQYDQSRPLQSDKSQAFASSSSNLPQSPPRGSATMRLESRVIENGSLNNLYSSGISPINEKKQLHHVHVARKSTKQPSNLGQTHVSPTPPVQRLSTDTPSANPRPAKRQRVLGVPNLSEVHPRSNSSSFSENGIPPSSKRGMFRQSEERTYKLSALEDFALRPKKKEAANESARSKMYNDRRQSYRGESHPSNSSRQTPTSSKPPQGAGLNGVIRPGSFVIDLTRDDSEPPLPSPESQLSLESCIPNGITVVGHQKPRRPSEGKPDLALNNKHGREGPHQPGGISQAEYRPSTQPVSKKIDTHAPQRCTQNVTPGASTEQTTSKSPKRTSSEDKQTSNVPTPNTSLGPVHLDSPNTSTHPHDLPPIEERQLANGIRRVSLNEKSPAPINLALRSPKLEQMAAKENTEVSDQATPIPPAPVTFQLHATGATTPHQNHETQQPVLNVQSAAVSRTEKDQSPTTTSQGPLSALLGGRKWEKMSPEERRLFWVSQHDPQLFDAQIYSENNRPFRPGDVLFGLPDDMLPPRPTRIATHFDYLDLRPRYSRQRYEEWYQQKQEEISARGGRKRNFGAAVKRAAQRKRAAPIPSQEQKRDSLPQRVRDNPKWLAALDVLEKLEAQAREKKRSRKLSQESTKNKASVVDATLDSDADMESG
ncbi:hypothetical protein F5Y12DRAFT_208318 [Xylaria sp. FL1777]|nr:hypothetical protein F5Y12DRAFT_208318 [Xylaria sp. FL1777]